MYLITRVYGQVEESSSMVWIEIHAWTKSNQFIHNQFKAKFSSSMNGC